MWSLLIICCSYFSAHVGRSTHRGFAFNKILQASPFNLKEATLHLVTCVGVLKAAPVRRPLKLASVMGWTSRCQSALKPTSARQFILLEEATHPRGAFEFVASRRMGVQMSFSLPQRGGRAIAFRNLGINPSYDLVEHETRRPAELYRSREHEISLETAIERGSAVMTAELHCSRYAYKRLLVHKFILVHSREYWCLQG